nr:DUF3822 family protein [Bacteroides sp.]
MTDTKLTPELIDDPRHWRLAMRLSADALHVTLHSPLREGSLIYRRIPLDGAAPSRVKAIESCVYDNPLLLLDFERTACVIESHSFVILPPGLDNPSDDDADAARRSIFRAALPDFDGDTFLSPSGVAGGAIMAGAEQELLAFLRRTFFNITLLHHLSPLCRYFLSAASRGSQTRIYINLRPTEADIIATDKGRLLTANTFHTPTGADAAYYALATHKLLGLPDTTEFLLSGDPAAREAVTTALRAATDATVMPVIFPSVLFRAGKDAMLAPFDLIILPLCE